MIRSGKTQFGMRRTTSDTSQPAKYGESGGGAGLLVEMLLASLFRFARATSHKRRRVVVYDLMSCGKSVVSYTRPRRGSGLSDTWEDLYVHRKSQLLLSISVDDIKTVEKKVNWDRCGKVHEKTSI